METKTGELVVVTGGAGFIGSHTVDALVERGHRVIVLDDFSTGRRENLAQWDGDPRVEVVEGDIASALEESLADAESRMGPVSRVVHLAAQTSVVRSIEEPAFDVRVNHAGSVNVFEYARKRNAKRVVFASSAAVYGDAAPAPASEQVPLSPLSPYGIHKRANELWARYASDVHGLRSVGLRFFNVYGPRQDPKSPYSGVISIFADRARAGQTLTIFGDGEQTRDFVYVGDVARALCDCLFHDSQPTDVFNIGTGHETTVNELAKMIVVLSEKQFGQTSEVSHREARPGEILRSLADITKAASSFGYAAKTTLPDGLDRTLRALAE